MAQLQPTPLTHVAINHKSLTSLVGYYLQLKLARFNEYFMVKVCHSTPVHIPLYISSVDVEHEASMGVYVCRMRRAFREHVKRTQTTNPLSTSFINVGWMFVKNYLWIYVLFGDEGTTGMLRWILISSFNKLAAELSVDTSATAAAAVDAVKMCVCRTAIKWMWVCVFFFSSVTSTPQSLGKYFLNFMWVYNA